MEYHGIGNLCYYFLDSNFFLVLFPVGIVGIIRVTLEDVAKTTPPRQPGKLLSQRVTHLAPGSAEHEISVDVAHFAVKGLLVLLDFVN